MKQLLFSTGNADKFLIAKHVCDSSSISLIQADIELPEIQEENPEKVALDKAIKAFNKLGKPVVISDDSWAFAGLKGFPGVYMHSINEWFTPEDFLRLTLPIENRAATLTQYLVYIDSTQQKIFTHQTKGSLLKEIRGTSAHPSHTIITIDGDNGLSIAEVYEGVGNKSTIHTARIWHDFVNWYWD